ncbi:MAG: hypothetical protein LIP12_10040 [Clostridiales bacterium]|nr:hypothetical protein [Clostridiales bacterium]
MDKVFFKHMYFGKTIKCSWTEDEYRLMENADTDDGTVKAVNVENLQRYNLLTAWLSNGVSEKEDRLEADREERESLFETLKLSDCVPADKIRFITPQYETLFEVPDLGRVKVNGEIRRVNWVDDFHFEFIEPRYSGCYHICEFAEIAKMNGLKIEKID